MKFKFQILLHENQPLVDKDSPFYELHGKKYYNYSHTQKVLDTVPESLQMAFYIKPL